MITPEKLAEWRKAWNEADFCQECAITTEYPEIMDTIEALWAVAQAAEAFKKEVESACTNLANRTLDPLSGQAKWEIDARYYQSTIFMRAFQDVNAALAALKTDAQRQIEGLNDPFRSSGDVKP